MVWSWFDFTPAKMEFACQMVENAGNRGEIDDRGDAIDVASK